LRQLVVLLPWLLVALMAALASWIGFELVRQGGRMLLRLETLEQQLAWLQAALAPAVAIPAGTSAPEFDPPDANNARAALASMLPAGDGGGRSTTWPAWKRSLVDSKINRNGLAAGTPAPGFRLPRVDGGELALEAYRGRRVLLVFTDPRCGPCDELAPRLEALSRRTPEVRVLLVSRGELEVNRAKVAEHGLTFPVGLQRHWEVSRDYALFATPAAYLIDEQGIILTDAAVGVEATLTLLASVATSRGTARASPPAVARAAGQ